MGGDVDAIWASLKAKTAPSQHAARAKALLRDARGDSSSQSTTRADRRRDASGTRPSYEHSVTGARAPEATDVHHPEREASDASRRVETRDVETERVSPSRASSDPPDENVEDGSGTVFADRSATVATEDALRRLTARDLNVLADTQSAPQTRVRASRHLREVLETRVEPALLAATAAELFLKPFLRRLEDASERCRESAADALAVLVRGIAACPGEDERGAVLDLLPYAVPVLRDRLGPVDEAPLSASDVLAGEPNASASASRARTDPREPSEEIRAKLHRVFRELLVNASQSSGNSLAAYASDAVLVLQFTAEDAFWEVAHEACVLLEALCDELGRRLSPVAKKLAWTFAPNLTHRRSKVRVATLRALRALMHCGAHETILDLCAFKHPNLVPIKAFYGEDRKVNYFGKLALDSCAPVRLAFVETLGDWMTTLVERADHEPRLLPYVMSAAADEAAAVRDAAAALLATLGAQYEREHEKDLKATMTYAPEHFGVEHSLGRDDSDGGDTSDPGDEEPRVLLYPPPFASRPGLGARVLVKNNFPAVVNPILAEMMGWQEDARVRASKLLRANLVFLEENATQHCQQLCLAFVKVCALTRRDAASTSSQPRLGTQSDSGASRAADVEPTVAQCCALVGAFVKPDEWLEVLLERCGPGNEPATVAGALAVTAECCAGAAAEDMLRETAASGASCPCDRILDVLEHPSLVGSSDTAARSSVCRFAETVLSRRPRTWGGGGRRESTGNRRLARLLGAVLRAGAGEETESPGDEAAEPARACRAAFAAAARALGTRSANARFDETRARNEMMARLRGELLAPLAALPRGAWRARDAASAGGHLRLRRRGVRRRRVRRGGRVHGDPARRARRRGARVSSNALPARRARAVSVPGDARAFAAGRGRRDCFLYDSLDTHLDAREVYVHRRRRDRRRVERGTRDGDGVAPRGVLRRRRARRRRRRRRARGRHPGKPPGRNLRAGNAGVSPRAGVRARRDAREPLNSGFENEKRKSRPSSPRREFSPGSSRRWPPGWTTPTRRRATRRRRRSPRWPRRRRSRRTTACARRPPRTSSKRARARTRAVAAPRSSPRRTQRTPRRRRRRWRDPRAAGRRRARRAPRSPPRRASPHSAPSPTPTPRWREGCCPTRDFARRGIPTHASLPERRRKRRVGETRRRRSSGWTDFFTFVLIRSKA